MLNAMSLRSFKVQMTILTAVPERRFLSWIWCSNGMNVRLPCRREALDRW
jgi:hypothetical protein